MSARWLGRRTTGSEKRLVARELLPGDTLCPPRGQSHQRVTNVARNAGSRTVDLLFQSGRRATFRYDADVTVERR